MVTPMLEIFEIVAHLLATVVRVAVPGGVRAVIVESLLLKHQLLVLSRSRKRASRLTPWDRLLFGIGAFLVCPPKDCDWNQTVDATALSSGADPAEIQTAVHISSCLL